MIYHIATHDALARAERSGIYTTQSLDEEGFVHCSTRVQVIPVANAVFKDVDEGELVLLAIDENLLTAPLRWEEPSHPDPKNPPDTGSAEAFPHVYGPLNLDAIVSRAPLQRDETGNFYWPSDLSLDTP